MKRELPQRYRIRCCAGCEDRHVGCHSDCEKYLAEKAEIQKAHDENNRQKALDIVAHDTRIRMRKKK